MAIVSPGSISPACRNGRGWRVIKVQGMDPCEKQTTNTVEYNGVVTQHVAQLNYGNLSFTNGGSNKKLLLRDMQINGDLLINSSASIYCDSNIITLYGDFTNNGSYITDENTLVLKGISKNKVLSLSRKFFWHC